MLSKNKIKYLKSLQLKKYRLQERKFVVEGSKIVLELIEASHELEAIYATKSWIENNKPALEPMLSIVFDSTTPALKAISSLSSVSEVAAIVKMAPLGSTPISKDAKLHLYLDGIRDPGNLGTLIRSAAWFGLSQIICSLDCVDFYNNKVLQASMGAFSHIELISADNNQLTAALPEHKLIGASLGGTSLQIFTKPDNMVLVIGNEGKGISPALLSACHEEITIARASSSKIESLNAAISGSILLSHLA